MGVVPIPTFHHDFNSVFGKQTKSSKNIPVFHFPPSETKLATNNYELFPLCVSLEHGNGTRAGFPLIGFPFALQLFAVAICSAPTAPAASTPTSRWHWQPASQLPAPAPATPATPPTPATANPTLAPAWDASSAPPSIVTRVVLTLTSTLASLCRSRTCCRARCSCSWPCGIGIGI